MSNITTILNSINLGKEEAKLNEKLTSIVAQIEEIRAELKGYNEKVFSLLFSYNAC